MDRRKSHMITQKTRKRMDGVTTNDLMETLRPIDSLISKSEKAKQKLAPGTWQHTMLSKNLKAMRMASALMNHNMKVAGIITRDDLQEALHSFASMIGKTEKSQATFEPGTSTHTLQRNRLKALLKAESIIKAALADVNEV